MKSEASFNTVDIMPTLLSLIGEKEKLPVSVEGTDFSRGLTGSENLTGTNLPKWAFLMNTGACAIWENGHEWRALRNKDFTYAVFRNPRKELLFDLTRDPYQMNNFALALSPSKLGKM